MSYAAITLTDSKATPVDHIFDFVVTQNNKVIRRNHSAPMEEPETLTMAHSTLKKGGHDLTSHMVRLDLVALDADGVTPRNAVSIRQVIEIDPRVYTDALLEDAVTMMADYCTEANMKLLVRGASG